MKKLNLFLTSLLLLASCTHFEGKRTLASISELTLLHSYKTEAARYILSHEPKRLGTFEDLTADNEKLLKLLQDIDLGKVQNIRSKIQRKHEGDLPYIDVTRAKALEFSEWQSLLPEILAAYQRGEHVFIHQNSFFTIWGLELNKDMISSEVIKKASRYKRYFDEDTLALALFNGQRALELSEDFIILLPEIRILSNQHLKIIKDDFSKQISPFVDVNAIDIINYNPKGEGLNLSNWEDYYYEKHQAMLRGESFESPDNICETRLYLRSLSSNEIPKVFVRTLIDHKEKLMRTLRLSNNDYDELMALSLGILAVESKMGESFKYFIKEDLKIGKINLGQLAIRTLKDLKGREDRNSRGLTQIKDAGPLLKDTEYAYLADADLDDPAHAAITTMFVLKEKLGYLRHFAKNHPNITSNNWADYLYYFYQGSSRQITKGLATPPLNLRIRKILELRKNIILYRNCDL